jgi:hypothetical protein
VFLHDNFDGFIMASDAPHYVATVMLPHVFEVIHPEMLGNRANAFIRKMRKDTPFWEDFPLFNTEVLDPWRLPRPQAVAAFCRSFERLPLAGRAHFLDFASRSDKRAALGALPVGQATSYATRKRGIDAEESAQLLIASALLVRNADTEAAMHFLSIKELKEFLAAERVEYKKSWNKDKLIGRAMEKCPGAVAEKAKKVCIARLSPSCQAAVDWAHEQIERSVSFFQVWLGFAFE